MLHCFIDRQLPAVALALQTTASGQAGEAVPAVRKRTEKAAGQTEKQMNLFFGWTTAFLCPEAFKAASK